MSCAIEAYTGISGFFGETETVTLSKVDAKRFQRLWASYDDLLWAEGFALYIGRKKLHAVPWARRKNSYFQAYAFTSAMITAYGRAVMDLPDKGADILKNARLAAPEADMHRLIMKRRHEIFAHSDPRNSRAFPVRFGDQEWEQTIVSSHPLTSFTADEIPVALSLIKKLKGEIESQKTALLLSNGFGPQPTY